MALVLILTSLTACSENNGKQFLGEWQKLKGDGPSSWQIVANGDQYLIQSDRYGKVGAIYKDGILVANEAGETLTISYIKESDSITVSGTEYVRNKAVTDCHECIRNLEKVNQVSHRWVEDMEPKEQSKHPDHQISYRDIPLPTMSDLDACFEMNHEKLPICPSGGHYVATTNELGDAVFGCSIPYHRYGSPLSQIQ